MKEKTLSFGAAFVLEQWGLDLALAFGPVAAFLAPVAGLIRLYLIVKYLFA
jgi:hypothetical protein